MWRCLLILACAGLVGCGEGTAGAEGLKILRIPMTTDGPKTLDPVRGSTAYENRTCSHIFEGLLQYKYLKRPYELEPCLLATMPERSADGRIFTFQLKQGVHFQDNACFPGGKGRELVARDVFYSWKRMADTDNAPKSWWLFANTIVGFDAYKDAQNAAAEFDYDAPVEGFVLFPDDPSRFQVKLVEPVTPFLYILAMFQTYVVPREAVEYYGDAFGRNPVGTGPYVLRRRRDWVTGQRMVLYRNPTYREDHYPTEWMPEDEALGLHEAAGKRLPFADRIDITFFVETQPQWLEFVSGNLDFTTVPAENFGEAFIKRTRRLRKRWRDKGV
jgi:ABC-type transport system substrate-binding protein